MSQPQTPCLLLTRLPRELRDRIYTEALVASEEINIENLEHSHLTHGEEFPEPELLHTCRQIRHEARKLYYSLNTFLAIVFDEDSTPPLRWLRSIGHSGRKALKRLIVRYQISPQIRNNLGSALRATLIYVAEGKTERCMRFFEGVGTLAEFDLDAIVLDTGEVEGEGDGGWLEHRKWHWKVDMGRKLERVKRSRGGSVITSEKVNEDKTSRD